MKAKKVTDQDPAPGKTAVVVKPYRDEKSARTVGIEEASPAGTHLFSPTGAFIRTLKRSGGDSTKAKGATPEQTPS